MPHAVTMPKLGMSMREGTVIEWRAAVGERIEKSAILLVIESEKAQVEIEATAAGVLRHIYTPPDETVPCGALLAALTDTADEPFDAAAFQQAHGGAPAAPRVSPQAVAPAPALPAAAPRRGAPVTPAARRRARELGVDAARIAGTGPGGRVTVEDVDAYAERRANLTPVADGISLEVLRHGDGDPVLLLPGFGTDMSAFALQTPALGERYRLLGVNPRGVGSSDAPDQERYTVADAANDAAAVAGGPAHVIGMSLGAAVGLELALTRPDLVRSLTLIAPFVRADGRLLAVCDGWCHLARSADAETVARTLLPWFFSPRTLADMATRARLLRGLTQTVARVPAATLERSLVGMAAWSGTREAALAALSVHTLVIAAADDVLTPGADAVAAAIPGAACAIVPDAGHAVGIEAPETVNAALLGHLLACP